MVIGGSGLIGTKLTLEVSRRSGFYPKFPRIQSRQWAPTEVYGLKALASSCVTSRANIWVEVLKSMPA